MCIKKYVFLAIAVVTAHASLAKATERTLATEEVIDDNGYNRTYDDPETPFKDRMKSARKLPSTAPTNERGGFVLGINGDFGPVYDAEPGSGSGMGFGLGVEPGFVIQNSSWSRIELGMELAFRSMSWKQADNVDASMTPITFMPRIGMGFGLGNNLFGVLRFGFGMATGQVALKSSGSTTHSDSKTGFVFSGAYDIAYGESNMQFVGGLGVTHYQYAFTANEQDLKLNLNHVNLHGGVRFKF